MQAIDRSTRIPWLGMLAVLLFTAAVTCGMTQPFGAAASETIGLALLMVALLCVLACRL